MLNQDHEEKYMLIKSTQPNMKLTTFCLISKLFNVNSLVCKNGYQGFFLQSVLYMSNISDGTQRYVSLLESYYMHNVYVSAYGGGT